MEIEQLKTRLQKDRPMTAVTIEMPVDVVDDLERVASLMEFSDNTTCQAGNADYPVLFQP